ncbi:MAG TPA: DoxX family protein [Blastocatellia bacterium]|nr:DoxX family protein [Blastocatellia bacterium]
MASGPGSFRGAWAALPLELIAGTILFAHGFPKIAHAGEFAERAMGGIPLFLAYLVIASEVGGGLLLLAGLLVRFSAFSHILVMGTAVVGVHWAAGLMGQGGFEFPLVLLGMALALTLLGPDPLSVDENLLGNLNRSRDTAFRRNGVDLREPLVKSAGMLLVLAGLTLIAGAALPPVRTYLGVPEGPAALVIAVIAGVASIVSGAALFAAKSWAYAPAFVVARLYLAASTLLLLYVKFALRGLVALLVSLAILASLRRARRGA